MKSNIGEEGTEQFTITTHVNGEMINSRPIHDPFVRTFVTLKGIGHAWRALRGGIKVQVSVDGTPGASRAIMTLDPRELQRDTDSILAERAESRAKSGAVGYYAEVNRG